MEGAKMCQISLVWFGRPILYSFLVLSWAYFSKPIFALKQWDWAGRFEYHEPYKPNDFFLTYKGVRHFFEVASPQAKSPQKWKKQIFS